MLQHPFCLNGFWLWVKGVPKHLSPNRVFGEDKFVGRKHIIFSCDVFGQLSLGIQKDHIVIMATKPHFHQIIAYRYPVEDMSRFMHWVSWIFVEVGFV